MDMRIIAVCLGVILSLCSWATRAQEALCAEVKIEILQELTMERQGFEALMRISNTLDTFSLENVSIKVLFKDADGNSVVATSNSAASNAAFFIRVDDTQDMISLQHAADGYVHSGSIAPKTVGEIRWLIIPTATAAGQTKDGKLYFVGAELKYSYGGKEEVVNVADDSIVVKPQPALTLDYFLTEEIVGDNGFTPEIEPSEPYTLGVRINNNGFGAAKSVKIESAQPRIVDNKLGLAVNFKILGSYLKDLPSVPSLLINFGTIEPKGISTGRWIMESNLAGQFIAFSASFTHADELGGELTSLLQATNANFLVRDVLMDLPGRDSLRDFLAYNAVRDLYLFESEPTGASEIACSNCKAVSRVENAAISSVDSGRSQFEFTPADGLVFASGTDPYSGTKQLLKVVRENGSIVHPQNAWLGKKRASDHIHFDYYINIFDTNPSGRYTVYWGGNLVDIPQPPVIQFVQDQVTFEGGNLGFYVRATDPNNTIPNLVPQQLPAGASFTPSANNEGVFNWSPAVGQAGRYTQVFTATDGVLTAERIVTIIVHSAHDTDGDGMDDDWERDKFGNLDKDGTEDSDGDGRSDLQEFEEGTDPNLMEAMPAVPSISLPIFNADVLDAAEQPLLPELVVTNGVHPAGVSDVAILFEIYKDEALSELMGAITLDEGTGSAIVGDGTTHWKISPVDLEENMEFEDNRLYFWRAKSIQTAAGSASSLWVKSQFFINTANDLPSVPKISSPALDASIAELSPKLVVTNSTDVDRDELRYEFELFAESNLDVPIATVSNILPGNNGQTSWFVAKVLEEDTRYLWRARVTDEHGGIASSDWGSFFVNTQNHPPTEPQVAAPEAAAVINVLGQNNGLLLRITNALDPERKPLQYYFELDTTNTFDSPHKKVSPAVNSGTDFTEWLAADLTDNTHYYWRVKASDGEAESSWVGSDFRVNLLSQLPSVPILQNPIGGVLIATQDVYLESNPSINTDSDFINYHMELYADSALTQLVTSDTYLEPYWHVEAVLADQATYYWRVRAEDDEGRMSAWSLPESFTINLPPINIKPQLSFVLPMQNVVQAAGNLLIQWQDSDPDSNANIKLLLKPAIVGLESIVLIDGLSEDLDGVYDTFQVDLNQIAPGTYSIVAEISDEFFTEVVTACCTLTIPVGFSNQPNSYWKFNEGVGQTTSSVDSIVGQLKLSNAFSDANARPAEWVDSFNSVAGKALQFDGLGAYVELPKAITEPLLHDSTLSFWYKGSSVGGQASRAMAIIGSHYNETSNHIKWGSLGAYGQFGIAVGEVRLLGMTPVTDGQWHHIAITRSLLAGSNGGLVKIYVDGNIDARGMPFDEKFNGLYNSLVGMVNNRFDADHMGGIVTTSRFIKGAIDNLRIYERALVDQEVAAIFSEESGRLPSPPNNFQLSNASTIYQAEAASMYLGQAMSDHAKYSGSGFADYDLIANGYIEWVLDSNVEKTVTLNFRYANGGTSDRPLRLYVNDQLKNSSLSFVGTGSWTVWKIVSVPVVLKPGLNKIRLTAIVNVGGPNIDYMEVVD